MPAPTRLPEIDSPPERWVDAEDFEITDEELELGNRLGQTIDVDDDEDGGVTP